MAIKNHGTESAGADIVDKKVRIGLVLATDFCGYPPGGGQPTIEIFLKYAQERPFDIWLFGVSTSRHEPVGKASKRHIYGREYPFVPLFYFDPTRYRNRKPVVPLRIRALLAYIWRRRIVDSMNFDLLYLHAPETFPFLWRRSQPVLYHIHGIQEGAALYSRYPIFRTRAFLRVYSAVVHAILTKADEFIVIDPESYERYRKIFPSRADRLHLLPTSVDTDVFKPRREPASVLRTKFGLSLTGRIILYVGRLSMKNGVDLAVRAFAALSKDNKNNEGVSLVIAGEGEERKSLEKLASALGVANKVRFLGHVEHDSLPSLYCCAEVSVVSSRYESLALVILEALGCGVPVVATPVGIASQVIYDGVTGYLVQQRDPEEMARRLKDVLDGRIADRKQCVAVAQEYSQSSKRICDVIETLCSKGGAVASGNLKAAAVRTAP